MTLNETTEKLDFERGDISASYDPRIDPELAVKHLLGPDRVEHGQSSVGIARQPDMTAKNTEPDWRQLTARRPTGAGD